MYARRAAETRENNVPGGRRNRPPLSALADGGLDPGRRTEVRFPTGALVLVLTLTPAAIAQQTVAEKTDYRATSRHSDVVTFCERLAKKSPVVRLAEIGKSGEGRTLPLLILADPPVETPTDVGKRLVVLLFANIHAGEVDGKEAVLMLARDLAAGTDKDLFKELVVLIVPILNPDGNERIDKGHRTEQNGPADGVGIRENAAGLDLNRDFVKLESPEIRALARLVRRWDPAVTVDLHTTNGSYHRYTLTYDGPRHPAAHPDLIAAVRDRWLPAIGTAIERDTGYKSFFYGNFSADRTAWESYPALPRFGIQWLALRNRVGLLSESYSYAPFKDRVLVGKAYAREILRYVSGHAADVRKLLAAADQPHDRIPLRTKTASLGERTVLGFVEEQKDGRRVPTKEPKEYRVTLQAGVEPTLEVQRPFAYLVPAKWSGVVETLQRHGIVVEGLREDAELACQVYAVEKATKAERVFQKHNLATIDVTRRDETRKVPAGTFVIRTGQRLGTLASFLLEPQSEDGLATWNAFDPLAAGADFPVVRVPKEAKVDTKPVPPLAEDR
jgi:dipeptidyl-peptidase 4